MRLYELSNKTMKDGRRRLVVILHEIYPDATQWNVNGLSWLKEYTENNIDSIAGRSITGSFLDDERTELSGHGDTGVDDSLPRFENAVVLGQFSKGWVDTITVDGEEKLAALAEGYIDEMRYGNFVKALETQYNQGETIYGSVEIIGKPENDNKIIYEDGWKPEGRVPVEYLYSGFALLGSGVKPADETATIVELNEEKKKEDEIMDEKSLQAIIDAVKSVVAEAVSKNEELEAEKNTAVTEKNEALATVEQLQEALDKAREELQKKNEEVDAKYQEIQGLYEELSKARAEKKIREMEDAVSGFSDEEKEYAKEDIDALKEDPEKVEINTIIDKIYRGIGKHAKEEHARNAETNSAKEDVSIDDIFSDMSDVGAEDNADIF